MHKIFELKGMELDLLQSLASELGIKGYKKMSKEDPADYVKSGGWKARQGGAGMELSKNVAIEFKPCATDAKSFNYSLTKPITSELYEFFKPFGILNFDMIHSPM